MLSQGQFFDPKNFDIHPGKLDFEGFRKTADFFHGQRTPGGAYTVGREFEWRGDRTHTHAGTEKAANQRLEGLQTGVQQRPGGIAARGVIYPLKHVGEYEVHPHFVMEDQGDDWDNIGTKNSQLYRNDVEDRGSISVVGPARNFQTYHQYLDTRPGPLTHKQAAERKGVSHFAYEPPNNGSQNWRTQRELPFSNPDSFKPDWTKFAKPGDSAE